MIRIFNKIRPGLFVASAILVFSSAFAAPKETKPTAAVAPKIAAAQTWAQAGIGDLKAPGNYAMKDGALSISGAGAGPNWNGKDQLQYVFQNYADKDVEIIARLVSFGGDPKAQAGIMLRESNAPDAAVASIAFNHQAWQGEGGKLFPTITVGGRDTNAAYKQHSGGSPVALNPPLWLRIDRLGRDYAVYKSPDGKVWSQVHNVSGGAFTPSGAINIGFYVASGDATKTASAVFDNIQIGKPRLGYRTSWIGTSLSQDSSGFVANGINAMFVEPDGTVHTNSYYDEGGEAAKVYKNGKVVKSISGNNTTYEGSITGDAKHIYLFHGLYGGAIQQIPLDGDPNTNGKTIFTASPLRENNQSIVGGMAVSKGTLFIGDTRDNKIIVAQPDAPVFYAAGNTSVNATREKIETAGVLHAAPPEIYQTQRETDYLPYIFPGYDTALEYSVRIHMAEYKHDKAGQRFMGLSAGAQNDPRFDIIAQSGAKFKAAVKQFDKVTPDAKGNINVTLSRVGDSPDPHIVVSGIEIFKPDGTLAFALNSGGSEIGKFSSDVAEISSRNFAFERPGPMVADAQGNLWIIQRATEFPIGGRTEFPFKGAVKCYSSDGKFTGRQITDVVHPIGLALDPTNGNLLVLEGGPDQNIRIYENIQASPKLKSTLGARGGIWAGKKPGLLNDPAAGGQARFYQPNALGVDAKGIIYVNNSGSGTDLRAYSPDGKVQWNLNSLHFVDCGDFDPDSDGEEIYTPFKHYTMDWSKTAPGGEWSFTGWNWNPFAHGAPPRNNGSSAVMRRLGANRNLTMFTSGQGQAGDILIFRMSGEQAIPCGRISHKAGGAEMWIDQNGDGKESAAEINTQAKGPSAILSFAVDHKGDIWAVGNGDPFMLHRYILQGVDARGTPQYGGNEADIKSEPFPETGIKARTWGNVGRVVYDSTRDAMYLLGPASFRMADKENPKCYLARYDNWSKGNRKATWLVRLPDPAEDPNFMYTVSMPYGLAFHWMAFDVADDKIFVAEMWGPIHVYDAKTGAFEIILNAGPQVSGGNAWEDMQMGVRAFRRKDGEYLVLSENSGFHGKNNLFRYRPPQ